MEYFSAIRKNQINHAIFYIEDTLIGIMLMKVVRGRGKNKE